MRMFSESDSRTDLIVALDAERWRERKPAERAIAVASGRHEATGPLTPRLLGGRDEDRLLEGPDVRI